MTDELSPEQIIEVATQEFDKFVAAINSRDIALGNEAIKNLKTLLDGALNEGLFSFDNLFLKGQIEYQDKSFCFTGKFDYGERKHCEAAVIAKGGKIEKRVTLKLDYLVVGSDFSPDWKHQNYGTKIEQVLNFRRSSERAPLLVHEKDWVKSFG